MSLVVSTRSIETGSSKVIVTNGDGVAGNPTIDVDPSQIDLSSLTGTVPISKGGTGQTTANAALNALLPSQSGNAGKVLSTDGTLTSWKVVQGSNSIVNQMLTSDQSLASTANLVQNTPFSIVVEANQTLYVKGRFIIYVASGSYAGLFTKLMGPSGSSVAADTFRASTISSQQHASPSMNYINERLQMASGGGFGNGPYTVEWTFTGVFKTGSTSGMFTFPVVFGNYTDTPTGWKLMSGSYLEASTVTLI